MPSSSSVSTRAAYRDYDIVKFRLRKTESTRAFRLESSFRSYGNCEIIHTCFSELQTRSEHLGLQWRLMEPQHGLEELRTGAYTAANSSDSPMNMHNMFIPLYVVVKYYGKLNMKKTHLSAEFLNHPTEGITVILLWNSERLLKENQKRQQQW